MLSVLSALLMRGKLLVDIRGLLGLDLELSEISQLVSKQLNRGLAIDLYMNPLLIPLPWPLQ